MDETLLEGLLSVQAALEAESRPIHHIYLRRDLREPSHLRLAKLAAARGIAVERIDAADIDEQAQGKTHGGVLALVGDRQFVSLETLIENKVSPCVVMLDGVEDPFNFGQAVRACYAAGIDGLVVRPRNWMSAAGVVARASAGASEWMPTAVAETAQDAADFFRKRGLKVAVTDDKRATSIYETDLTQPLFLLIGGEKRGVTRSFADAADMRLTVPYGRAFGGSLGTTSATAAVVFEIMRQRMSGI